ncbi:unnamed protein product [Nesidiocoris tenuis]|uniref:Uncharacterized protein n=1 Tax=Nesidiocoris tenuis TaxID=355587 RepID=A0A6H5GTR9_9HEMI|nr:unnamed protein product [Nesidiocoris tenuis]
MIFNQLQPHKKDEPSNRSHTESEKTPKSVTRRFATMVSLKMCTLTIIVHRSFHVGTDIYKFRIEAIATDEATQVKTFTNRRNECQDTTFDWLKNSRISGPKLIFPKNVRFSSPTAQE